MTPEEWRRAKTLFEAAIECEPEHRSAFLDQVCSPADAGVRREVEALLAAHEESDSFLESPAADINVARPVSRTILIEGDTVGRYKINELLGSGGMGDVYLAEDPRLGRKVALKLLPKDVGADQDRLRRFEQEARTASALSHPNVCVIYEIGETEPAATDESRRFIAMEYVNGESLRDLIDRHNEGGASVPIGEAVDIAQQVAAGLEAAHAAGVVHRDIKPENVMVRPDGLVKVLDFGLAKLTERPSSTSPDGRITRKSLNTEAGIVLGTVQYMSPEQARGLAVDARSDVWSLGCVLYEMISGRPPFIGETTSDIIVAVLDREPPPLETLESVAPAVVSELKQVVATALRKDRAERMSIAEMAAALKRIKRGIDRRVERESEVAGSPVASAGTPASTRAFFSKPWARPIAALLAIGVLVASGLLLVSRRNGREPMTPGVTRLAVLPFENLGRTEDAYVADGMTDEVRGKLSLLPGLQVIARSSSIHYRGSAKPQSEIARELGVRYLLTGTVRWERRSAGGAGRVRVSPELVDVTGGGAPVTKWQESFDAALTDVFEVQADVASRVAQELDVRLGAGERARLAARPTENLAAYDAYLQGEEVSNGLAATDPVTLPRAIRFYERAVALDSSFAQAWGRLAGARILLHHYSAGGPSRDILAAAARTAAERALTLAPDRPDGWVAMSAYYQLIEFDMTRAAEQVARGLQIAPNDAGLLVRSGFVGESLGRWEQALDDYRRAATLDPRSAAVGDSYGSSLLWRRRYPEARAALDRALALAPDNVAIREHRAMVELALGDLAGARTVLRAAPSGVKREAIAAYFATYWDLSWSLDDALQQLLLTLSPEAFGDDRLQWSMALADASAFRRDAPRVRMYADSARAVAEAGIRKTPDDVQLHIGRGVALAYLGRRADAMGAGEHAVKLMPVSMSAWHGAYLQHQLARIYILVGEPEKALDQLEPLLKMPYFLSPGWLRIDPNFAALRGNPRFERLARGTM